MMIENEMKKKSISGEIMEEPKDDVMQHLLSPSMGFKDARDISHPRGSYSDGSKVEGTAKNDTRTDYILLSPGLRDWQVKFASYEVLVRAEKLNNCNHAVLVELEPKDRREVNRLPVTKAATIQGSGANVRVMAKLDPSRPQTQKATSAKFNNISTPRTMDITDKLPLSARQREWRETDLSTEFYVNETTPWWRTRHGF